jgi:hypothetical protein
MGSIQYFPMAVTEMEQVVIIIMYQFIPKIQDVFELTILLLLLIYIYIYILHVRACMSGGVQGVQGVQGMSAYGRW